MHPPCSLASAGVAGLLSTMKCCKSVKLEHMYIQKDVRHIDTEKMPIFTVSVGLAQACPNYAYNYTVEPHLMDFPEDQTPMI